MKDLSSLVSRAQAGDVEAFGALVRQFQDMAVGYAYSIVGDFGLAEDAAQEAFIRTYWDLGKLRQPKAFPGWFRKIVFGESQRLVRGKRVPTVPLDEAIGGAATKDDPLSHAQRRERQDRVLGAVRALPEKERIATTLFYINGYSMAEVGEFLDVPVSTVKNRLHSARKRLRERVLDMVEDTLKGNAPAPDTLRERIAFLLDMAKRFARGENLGMVLDHWAKAARSDPLRAAVQEILDAVMAGSTLSEALAQHSQLFPPKVVSLVRDGEMRGLLEVFTRLAGEWIETGRCKVDPHVYSRCLNSSHWFSDAVACGAESVCIRAEDAPTTPQTDEATRVWLEYVMPDGTVQKTHPYYSHEEAARLSKSPEPFRNLHAALDAVQFLKFQTVLDEIQKGNETTGTLRIRLKPEDKQETRLPICVTAGSIIDEVRVALTPLPQP